MDASPAAEHHLTIQRTARYYTLGLPEQANEVWFVLHGYGQLAQYFIRSFRALDDSTRFIVAPEALSRFYLNDDHGRVGASWMTKADREREIEDYLLYLNTVAEAVHRDVDLHATRTCVLGFSQGAATASRWTALGDIDADRLILWAGDLAHDLDLSAHAATFSALDVHLVVGSDDPYLTPDRVDALRARLDQHAIPFEMHTFDGGHHIPPDVLSELV